MEEELKLVSVSGDHTAVLWDVSIIPWRQVQQFRGHTRSVKTVAFRPQDKGKISFVECSLELSHY
jgi:denticleless